MSLATGRFLRDPRDVIVALRLLVLAGLTMLARTRTPVRFVATVAEAEEALREALAASGATAPKPGEIVQAADALRAEMVAEGAVF